MMLYQVRSEVSAYRKVLGQVRTLKFVRAIVNAAALAPGVIDVCFGKSYASRPTVVLTQQHPTSATGKLTLEQLRWVQTTDNCVVVSQSLTRVL